jgi:hypothetical protein
VLAAASYSSPEFVARLVADHPGISAQLLAVSQLPDEAAATHGLSALGAVVRGSKEARAAFYAVSGLAHLEAASSSTGASGPRSRSKALRLLSDLLELAYASSNLAVRAARAPRLPCFLYGPGPAGCARRWGRRSAAGARPPDPEPPNPPRARQSPAPIVVADGMRIRGRQSRPNLNPKPNLNKTTQRKRQTRGSEDDAVERLAAGVVPQYMAASLRLLADADGLRSKETALYALRTLFYRRPEDACDAARGGDAEKVLRRVLKELGYEADGDAADVRPAPGECGTEGCGGKAKAAAAAAAADPETPAEAAAEAAGERKRAEAVPVHDDALRTYLAEVSREVLESVKECSDTDDAEDAQE